MAKGKNLFTKLGLIEEDIPVAPKKAVPQPTRPTPPPTTTYQNSGESFVSVDPQITEMITQSLKSAQLSGFDYMKFVSAVEAMKTTGTAEDARFKMAYFTAQQLGVGKQDLLQSGSHYLDVLKENEADFSNDCSQYEKKEIEGRQAQMADLEKTMKNLSAQLAKAQQDYQELSAELQSQKSTLDSRRASFSTAIQQFRASIESNIAKINQYLQ